MSQLDNLRQQWQAMPAQSRRLAIIGLTVVVLLLVYTIGWRTLQKDLVRLRVSVPNEKPQLEWMRAYTPVAKSLRAKMTSVSGGIIPTLEQSSTTQGIRPSITKIEPDGTNGARLTIEGAAFNTLVTWLADLQASNGIVSEEATFDAQATPGIVNARLRLRIGGN